MSYSCLTRCGHCVCRLIERNVRGMGGIDLIDQRPNGTDCDRMVPICDRGGCGIEFREPSTKAGFRFPNLQLAQQLAKDCEFFKGRSRSRKWLVAVTTQDLGGVGSIVC